MRSSSALPYVRLFAGFSLPPLGAAAWRTDNAIQQLPRLRRVFLYRLVRSTIREFAPEFKGTASQWVGALPLLCRTP